MFIDELIKFCKQKSENIKLKAEPQVFVEIAEKLEELKICKDLEEQGLIVKLPCRVGDEFWAIAYKSEIIIHVKCSGYTIEEDISDGIKHEYVWIDSVENPRDYWKLDFEVFKKQCFSTEEEAEQALKQMGE